MQQESVSDNRREVLSQPKNSVGARVLFQRVEGDRCSRRPIWATTARQSSRSVLWDWSAYTPTSSV